MKKQYLVYRVSTEMPIGISVIAPGCTLTEEQLMPEDVKIFDNREAALGELEKRTSFVYPRVQCRKAYYEVCEWRMDEAVIDEDGRIIEKNNCCVAKMDLSELEEDENYMP